MAQFSVEPGRGLGPSIFVSHSQKHGSNIHMADKQAAYKEIGPKQLLAGNDNWNAANFPNWFLFGPCRVVQHMSQRVQKSLANLDAYPFSSNCFCD